MWQHSVFSAQTSLILWYKNDIIFAFWYHMWFCLFIRQMFTRKGMKLFCHSWKAEHVMVATFLLISDSRWVSGCVFIVCQKGSPLCFWWDVLSTCKSDVRQCFRTDWLRVICMCVFCFEGINNCKGSICFTPHNVDNGWGIIELAVFS